MGAILTWWDNLALFGQILACMSIPATVIMAIQTMLLIFGGAFSHSDGMDFDSDGADFDSDGDFDSDAPDLDFDSDHDLAHGADGLRIFTIRGVIAFFAVGGWVGLAVWAGSRSPTVSSISAFISGVAALVLSAYIIKWSLGLQESGNISARNAIGSIATVYIPIPAQRSGCGHVTLTLQERFVEMEAVTDSEDTLKTGRQVQVVGVVGENRLIVKSI
ncbi:MAG: hypothetical protein LBM60_01810 [Clostridium sp.]|jgi:hypothetical protein|nr:hypothetical protein [Clostridium sp.]